MRTLSYVILGLLKDTDLTEPELLHSFDTRISHFWSIKHNQFQPELRKLTAGDYITCSDHNYHITEKGLQKLCTWLNMDEEIHTSTKDHFCLRLLFSDYLDANKRRQLLISQLYQHRARLRYLKQTYHGDEENAEVYLVLQHSLIKEKAAIEWLELCIQYFKRHS